MIAARNQFWSPRAKKMTLMALLAMAILPLSACAHHKNKVNKHYGYDRGYEDTYTVSAKVIKVKPIYESYQVNRPETECWNERVKYRGHRGDRHYGGMITGGIIGGLAGHQVGGGRGKDVATVVGTIVGAAIGDNLAHSNHRKPYSKIERRCETIDHYETRKEIVGYKVKYRYDGQTHWTRTDTHPGSYIRVKVKVKPLG